MAKSKAKAEADARYDKKAYDRIELKIRKDTEINRELQSRSSRLTSSEHITNIWRARGSM